MKILSIELQDVKSYDQNAPQINFHSGVNAIIGENGSGKSTLCEAVGFALFDYLHPYSQADFVRDGKKTGKVIISFQSDIDGKKYRVERGVSQSRYDVYDLEEDHKLSFSSKDDVISWLKEHLGIPETMNIQTLWKSSLGVPQGKFTNDFSQTPSIRAELFNPLLEVDIYRGLWQKMKGVIDVLHQKKANQSDKITRLESNIEDLPDLKKQQTKFTNEINKTTKAVTTLKKKIKENQKEKTRFETIEKQIQDLSHTLELINEKQKDIQDQFLKAEKELTSIKKAETLVKKHSDGYQQYVTSSTQLEKLSEKKKTKDTLANQVTDLEKKQTSIQHQISQYKQEITVAKKSKEIMETLKPSIEKQEQLEQQLDEIKHQETKLKELMQQQKQIKQQISDLRSEFRSVQKQIDSITKMKGLAEKQVQLQQEKDELLQKQSILHHQKQQQQASIQLLSTQHQPRCPTCSRPLEPSQKKEIIQQKNKEINHSQQTQQQVDQQLEKITDQLKKATEATQELKRLNDLQKIATSIQKEAEAEKKKKKENADCIQSLQDQIDKKQKITKQLQDLNNPKIRYQQAEVRYHDHSGKEKYLEKSQEQLNKIKKKQDQLKQQLDKFKQIQDQIDVLKEKQKKVRSSYETVIRYQDRAEKRNKQEHIVDQLQQSLKEIQQRQTKKTNELKKQKQQFNGKKYQEVKKILEEQKQKQIRQQTQIEEWKKQQSELINRIEEKKKAKEKLQQTKKQQQSLIKDIEFALFLRETFQQTRPLITEILVKEISREADRIYRQLRGVPSEELSWTKDYEIVITEGENKRSFHKLSGGEQMCAALAVRLAILKLLSKMDIVFLDEPTMNLDEHKKDNLVSQLRDLTGFSQIFVISHDETFESMTEHVITLEKKKGATRLLQHFQGGF